MRKVVLGLLIVNGFFLPLGCCPISCLFLGFWLTDRTVENRTPNTIYVTPIGRLDGRGKPRPMVLSERPHIHIPPSPLGRFPVQSGETTTFYYDWDDVYLTELVIETEDGQLRQLSTDGMSGRHIVIDDRDNLEPVDPDVRHAYDEAVAPTVAIWPYLVGCTIPWFTFPLLLLWNARLNSTQLGKSPPSQTRL
jgi:hypothetical protein